VILCKKDCCQVPLLSTSFERAALPFFPNDRAAFGCWMGRLAGEIFAFVINLFDSARFDDII